MSSGFVAAGTDQEPVERDDEWRRAQQELEEERRRKAELGRQEGGKSLYEVLQQNKMAKQEAFEEKIKLKNQFRSLDEDEVEFLDSIMESTRAQEAAVKKETAEQLELFRRQREEAEKALLENSSTDVVPSNDGEDWKIPARKRRRDKSKELLIPGKKRKSTSEGAAERPSPSESKAEAPKVQSPLKDSKIPTAVEVPPVAEVTKTTISLGTSSTSDTQGAKASLPAAPAAKSSTLSLGLAGYSSDSE
ncbi:PSME3-interacting protein [Aspergillus fischeri NRRL 181]|uniref:FAM192A/Fyv6 N-terminal domain-containing protein n=1 Tax=Neosartorya fischeri (strain ATCC 1020 / DSM 3700 / CBS 544.65 / FGSC A1164 / JCM 1740 / NRRL 181 / WB 181) TaxID=331117 RepID=A1D385_NEOFI|nr:conserved hypothetical protein [Aspergillus fischeri NRRL 181]EAW22878.1 conserved hypothetical protein [Aspergillus fischeri NRRL 181]